MKTLIRIFLSALFLVWGFSLNSCDELASMTDNPVKSYLVADTTTMYLDPGQELVRTAKTISTAPVLYESSNKKVATVDENGCVHAVAAGEAKITIKVEANEYYKADSVQYKVVVNRIMSTIQQVNEGVDGKAYSVKGRITQIAQARYGNIYIEDETGTLYIYGMLDKQGKTASYPLDSWGLEIGDVILVEGIRKDYKGTIELTDVTVVEIEKALLKITDPESAPTIDYTGGNLKVKIVFKGESVTPTIALGCDWIHYSGTTITSGTPTADASTAEISFTLDQNDGDLRKSAIIFKSSKGTITHTTSLEVTQKANSGVPSGTGTAEDPYNVTAAINAAQNGATDVYVKGVVSKAPTTFKATDGNLGYYISVDGTTNNELQVYHGFSFDGAHFTAKENIKKGDVVIIKGNLKMYNSSPELDANNQLVQINCQTTLEGLDDAGSYRNPFDIAAAISYINGSGTGKVFVKGIVSALESGGFKAQYGNGSFWISDDGKKYNDSAKDFEAYRVLWLGNKQWTTSNPQIAVGDIVILYGELTKYTTKNNTTYETKQNKAYVFSLNGKIE